MYRYSVLHRGVGMDMKDSFKLISAPLSTFQRMFSLPEGKKKAIPYTLYTTLVAFIATGESRVHMFESAAS